MSAQEIFNQAVSGVLSQGRASVAHHTNPVSSPCMYRGPGGTKCAVGHVLTDEEFTFDMEGHPVGDVTLPDRLQEYISLLGDLQLAHDSRSHEKPSVFLKAFARRARQIARAHGLDASVIDQFKTLED